MKKKSMIKILTAVMMFVLAFGTFAGCSGGSNEAQTQPKEPEGPVSVGTLNVKVNPEFDVNYDEAGKVTTIEARNQEAAAILEGYTGYEGKKARVVVKDLVKLMDKAGYVDKKNVKGDGKKITIQVTPDSELPNDRFLKNVVKDVKGYFDNKKVTGKLVIEGESAYGMSEYAVSDYGDTNYKERKTAVKKAAKSGSSYTDYANTDYDGYNTDYDAKTDYDGNNTDYVPAGSYSSGSGSSGGSGGYSGGSTNYSNYNSGYGGGSGYDGGS